MINKHSEADPMIFTDTFAQDSMSADIFSQDEIIAKYGREIYEVFDCIHTLIESEKIQKALNGEKERARKKILKYLNNVGKESLHIVNLCAKKVESEYTVIDEKRLKAEMPEIYNKYKTVKSKCYVKTYVK
jgi:hypothetical protein